MIKLKVNGVSREFDGEPDMPLLWYLRDELQMTGTKYGCGAGLCGACTVHVGGNRGSQLSDSDAQDGRSRRGNHRRVEP